MQEQVQGNGIEEAQSKVAELKAPHLACIFDEQLEILLDVSSQHFQGFECLAPINGWLVRQTRVLENYYRFAPETSPLAELIRSLFYRTEGVEFELSKKSDRIATYLSPFAIGVLAGELVRCSEEDDIPFRSNYVLSLIRNDEKLLQTLSKQQDLVGQLEILREHAVVSVDQTKGEIERIKKLHEADKIALKRELVARDTVFDTIINSAPGELRKEFRQLALDIDQYSVGKSIKQATSESQKQEWIAYNQVQEQKKRCAQESRQLLLERALDAVEPTLQDAYRQACCEIRRLRAIEQNYPARVNAVRERMAEEIQRAWSESGIDKNLIARYLRSDGSARHFDQYLDSLIASLNPGEVLAKDLVHVVEIIAKLTKPNTAPHDRHVAINALMGALSYRISSSNELYEYLSGVSVVAPQCLVGLNGVATKSSNDFQEGGGEGEFDSLALKWIRRVRLESPTPPLASTRFAVTSNQGKEFCFPDCGETTVRNFINLFLYDPASQRFQVERLKESGLNWDAKVIEFYQKNASSDSTRLQRVHDEWAALLSDMGQGIDYILPYNAPICEIRPGARNAAKVLTTISGAPSFDRLVDALNAINPSVKHIDASTFSFEERDEFKNMIAIHFDGVRIEWYFLKRHYRMYEKWEHAQSEVNLAGMQMVFEDFGSRYNAALLLNIIGASLRRNTVGFVENSDWYQLLNPNEALHALLSTRLDWMEDLESIGLAAIAHPGVRSDTNCCEYVKNILMSISSFDGYQSLRDSIADRIEYENIVELLDIVPRLREKVLTSTADSKFHGRKEMVD